MVAYSDLLILRVYESTGMTRNKLIVTRNSKIIRSRDDLESIAMPEGYEGNQAKIGFELEKYIREGFKINNITSGGHQSLMVTTFILVKE